jgi:hypothetical protein
MARQNPISASRRPGYFLKLGSEPVAFGKHILARSGANLTLQHRLFVNDPWELIAEAIHRALPKGKTRDLAHSFRRQAEDYFRTATIGRELAVRPVLLYYAFLNLSKAYALAKGRVSLAGTAYHGLSAVPKPRAVLSSLIRFDIRKKPAVFEELLHELDGNPGIVKSGLSLGKLLPQILPGHRLWCYAANQAERFLAVERFEVLHSHEKKEVWLNLFVHRNDLGHIGVSPAKALANTQLSDFEVTTEISNVEWVCFQQQTPTSYAADSSQALAVIISGTRNKIWETVRISSPYRKPYIYCCPSTEHRARLRKCSPFTF